MGWVDKQHKKAKIHNLVEQAMKDPQFQEAQKKQTEEAIREAFDCFLLISADYLHRHHSYGKKQTSQIPGICGRANEIYPRRSGVLQVAE